MKFVFGFSAVAMVATFALSCGGGDPPGGVDVKYGYDNSPGEHGMDYIPSDDNVRPDDPGQDRDCTLAFDYVDEFQDPTGGCRIKMNFNQSWEVRAKYAECEEGFAGELVTFEVVGETEPGVCTILYDNVYTDTYGVAASTLRSGNKRGQCEVRACIADTDICLDYSVCVEIKDPNPLTVGFETYTGQHPLLDTGKIVIYKQEGPASPVCASVDPLNLPQGGYGTPDMSILNSFAFKTLPNLDKDLTQTWTVVGVAWESSDQNKTIRAWGCKEVTVEWMGMRTAFIELKDIPPRLVGTYDLDSEFDLVSGLPPNVATVINFIIDFFQNPTGALLKLMCDPNLGGSYLETICEYLFIDPKKPELDSLSWIGSIASELMNAILIGLLVDNCPDQNRPETCADIIKVGGDVGSILRKFHLLSTVRCDTEPDRVTRSTTCFEVWHTVVLRWTLGKDCELFDPECGKMQLSFYAIPGIGAAVSANMQVSLDDKNRLAVEKHPIDLKYGAIINFAIEKILLPQIFGDGSDGLPAVDSYESLIGSLLAGKGCLVSNNCCQTFATNLINQTGPAAGLTTNLVKGACDALIQTGSVYLRNFLVGLDATPQNFTLGTPVGQPCQLYDANRDMKFDAWGKSNDPCLWDAGLKIGGTTYSPDGTFFGVRP
jgi:hypothetical protein